MARLAVNPTRMELSRLKARLQTSLRGHKLLKDKRDDLMKKFLELARQNRSLREVVEAQLAQVYDVFVLAQAILSPAVVNEAFLLPKQTVSLQTELQNVMGVSVPQFTFSSLEEVDLLSYGFFSTTGELDDALSALRQVLPSLLELAEMEKRMHLMAQEIEKTRRRVNALEYVLIPSLRETIRFITLRLSENERGNISRLMKIKDAMLKEQLLARQEEDAYFS